MIKKIVFLICGVVCIQTSWAQQAGINLYVSPEGILTTDPPTRDYIPGQGMDSRNTGSRLAQEVFLRRGATIFVKAPKNAKVRGTGSTPTMTHTYTVGARVLPISTKDFGDGDFTLEFYPSGGDIASTNDAPHNSILIKVARKTSGEAIALTGVAVRSSSAATGYALVPTFDANRVVNGQMITKTYLDAVDLNFSAGLVFVNDEQSDAALPFEKLFSLGMAARGKNRTGFLLAINQPSNSNASFRAGPIIFLNRDMDTAIAFGIEAFQGQRFYPGTYSFGDVLPVDGTINAQTLRTKWFTGLYFGFVYRVGNSK